MKRHVLILGAGFGGLELATRLSETVADAVDVTLIDRNDSFYFGFSKLEVMIGRESADAVRLPYADIAKDGVKVLVSVLGQPFKCPPAPFEGSFLLHEHFTRQGVRDAVQMATTFPMQRPVPVTGEVSQMFRDGLAARRIEELPQHLVTGIDPAARVARLATDETLPYDLFVGIPVHRAPDPLEASGLAVEGWVPVDQTNLRTRFPQVYALGDVCTGARNVPKAGIFAESAALVVADDIAAEISGEQPPAPYEASGVCYAEFGDGLVSKVDVNFLRGEAPAAQRHDPSREYAAEKAEFGATRRARWFGS